LVSSSKIQNTYEGEPTYISHHDLSIGFDVPEIAVIIPCLNEALTVDRVVRDFRKALPGAVVYVYDNGSCDGTASHAEEAGAVVRHVLPKGKGAVLRQAFGEVEADYYIVVDGDDTYPAEAVCDMLLKAQAGADMVCGDRLTLNAYKRRERQQLHNLGNRLICAMISLLLGVRIRDALTGYRVLSRRFVKDCPILLDGFEVETEMTIYAVGHKFSILEVPIAYGHRPEGSESKIRTLQDGILILRAIVWLGKDTKPFKFFGFLAGLSFVASLVFFFLPLQTAQFFAWACFALGLTMSTCGLILDTVTKQYLQGASIRRRNR
jgi:glycosyltransferase involved in cell wall biosynthesis